MKKIVWINLIYVKTIFNSCTALKNVLKILTSYYDLTHDIQFHEFNRYHVFVRGPCRIVPPVAAYWLRDSRRGPLVASSSPPLLCTTYNAKYKLWSWK